MIDHNLKFDAHASFLQKKVFTKLKVSGHLRQFISRDLSITLYKSLVILIRDYADTIYDARLTESAKSLQAIQKCYLCICIAQDHRSNVIDLHHDTNIATLSL